MALNLPFGRLTRRLPSRTSTMKYVDFAPCCFDFAKNDRPPDRQPGWERTTKGAPAEADARIAANALPKRSIARLSIGCRIQTLAASGR